MILRVLLVGIERMKCKMCDIQWVDYNGVTFIPNFLKIVQLV